MPRTPITTTRSTTRLRVAMLLPFPLTYQDGVTRFVVGLLRALQCDQSVDTQLIAPARIGAARRRPVQQLTVAVHHLVRLLRGRPDIVHVHEHPVLLGAAIVYKFVAMRPVRVVHTVHIEPVGRWPLWKRLILGWLMNRCWAVTAVSADTARRLVDVATPLPRVQVVHGGSDLEVRGRDDRAVASFLATYSVSEGPILCQIGLNFPRKVAGVLRLIEAFATVRRSFPGAQLLLVGTGAFQARVAAAAAQHGLGSAVVLTDYLSDVSIPLAAADLYCHITLQDACPLSVLEAMRVGKPIVAARTGGIPELIVDGHNGVLVDPEPATIAAAIIELLSEPDTARALGQQAAATARSRFTWQRVADEFEVVYGWRSEAPSPDVVA
ncbi:MAG: glycosyltransferase family 4 protein [Chloroflexi bacterium]|nr:glycosyltransferase family 4 protein [Chloroflexota bacterium]